MAEYNGCSSGGTIPPRLLFSLERRGAVVIERCFIGVKLLFATNNISVKK